ncbi:hypothetical protein L1049_023956 [Liquidambar formosana]|uniref:RING-CH-type domain-containing protein n=1 Tax=Liquidambar formosana TaxID=63359 RepID=A0AAP0S0F2_LIQFO
MDRDMHKQQGDIENSANQIEQGTSGNSWNQVGGTNSETVIVIKSEEAEMESGEDDGKSKTKMDTLETSKVTGEKPKVNRLEPEKNTCVVVDVTCDIGRSLSGENFNREKVCRICHLSFQQNSAGTSDDLMQLGCGCKGELGISHRYCAEAWFKHKGNRKCEICGGTAKNITGIGDIGFRAGWNETRLRPMGSSTASTMINSSNGEGSCKWGKHFCGGQKKEIDSHHDGQY